MESLPTAVAFDPSELKQISRMVRGVRKKSPVRAIAENLLQGLVPEPLDVQALVNELAPGSRANANVKAVAAWALSHSPATREQAEEYARLIIPILDNRPQRSIGCFMASGCLFAWMGWIWIAYAAMKDTPINKRREIAAGALGRLGATSGTFALARAIEEISGQTASGDKGARIAAARGLAQVYRRWPDEPRNAVTPNVVTSLCRMLFSSVDDGVLIALDCISVIAPIEAIPNVERLAKRRGKPMIQQAAIATLKGLREKEAASRDYRTLLRPSDEARGDAAALLRPAQRHPKTIPCFILPWNLRPSRIS